MWSEFSELTHGDAFVLRQHVEHITLLVLLAALDERTLAEHRAHRSVQRLCKILISPGIAVLDYAISD